MRFKIKLEATKDRSHIPINYQYPLSSAIYRIIAKGDEEYARFLHEEGYGKGYKFFTFSDISCPFRIESDRLHLQSKQLEFEITFHLPKALETFIQGLFRSETICIADQKSKTDFRVMKINSLPNELAKHEDRELIHVEVRPQSPIVAGVKNERGVYEYLAPDHPRFVESLTHNWREKIKANWEEQTADEALLLMEVHYYRNPPKARLTTIKADTEAETKIKGYNNFLLNLKAEKRFVELLLNSGIGLYNAQGMGCLGIKDN